jgi:hypothetical protein
LSARTSADTHADKNVGAPTQNTNGCPFSKKLAADTNPPLRLISRSGELAFAANFFHPTRPPFSCGTSRAVRQEHCRCR